MQKLARSIYEVLLRYTVSPDFRRIKLAVDPNEDGPAIRKFTRACEDFLRENSGRAKDLRQGTLDEDAALTVRAGVVRLSDLVQAMLTEGRKTPEMPWIAELLALPAESCSNYEFGVMHRAKTEAESRARHLISIQYEDLHLKGTAILMPMGAPKCLEVALEQGGLRKVRKVEFPQKPAQEGLSWGQEQAYYQRLVQVIKEGMAELVMELVHGKVFTGPELVDGERRLIRDTISRVIKDLSPADRALLKKNHALLVENL